MLLKAGEPADESCPQVGNRDDNTGNQSQVSQRTAVQRKTDSMALSRGLDDTVHKREKVNHQQLVDHTPTPGPSQRDRESVCRAPEKSTGVTGTTHSAAHAYTTCARFS